MKKSVLMVLSCAALAAWADSPVKGRMGDPLLVCGQGRAFLVAPDGHVAWNVSGCGNIHRVWKSGDWVYWSNGDLYRTDILTGKSELFYKPCAKEGIFGFEVLKDGNIVVAENGTDYITELKAGTTNAVVRFKADPRDAQGKTPNAHHHFRMVRKTPQGTYLVCCSGATIVREYDAAGKLLWEQPTPRQTSGHAPVAFDALRRANGNTLVSHLGAVTEFTPDHQVAWQFSCADAPALKLDNLCGLWEKKNGNLVVGTYANGAEDGSRATAFEITRDKKVVWSYAAAGKRFSMMTAFPVPGWTWPITWNRTTPQDEVKIEEIVGDRLAAQPKQARRVLMFARTFGYSHNDALAYGNRAFEIAAQRTKAFSIDFSTDVSLLGDPATLARYDAVVLNNCTFISVKRFPAVEKALTDYVKGGKGLCLIHSAVDSFYDSEAVADMNGGLFKGHPWMAGGKWSFTNEEPDHPVAAPFKAEGSPFARSDEIYQQTEPAYSRAKDRVLISMNMADKPTAAAAENWKKAKRWLREDGDFAVAWVRRYGAGRVFYTSFGHDKRAFCDKARLHHMLAGLQYCLGDLDCADAPRK